MINEEWLRMIFEKYGPVEDVKIARYNVQDVSSSDTFLDCWKTKVN